MSLHLEMQPESPPMSPVELELWGAYVATVAEHKRNPTPETWQRRIAARAGYMAVYDWNRAT